MLLVMLLFYFPFFYYVRMDVCVCVFVLVWSVFVECFLFSIITIINMQYFE